MPGNCDPPKEHQFSSTNQPKKRGRKKGSKNFKTIYKKYLNLKMNPKESGFEIPYAKEGEKLTLKEMIVLRHIKKAIGKADYKDIQVIMDRVDGLLKQEVEHSGQIDNKVEIVLIKDENRDT